LHQVRNNLNESFYFCCIYWRRGACESTKGGRHQARKEAKKANNLRNHQAIWICGSQDG
jgi:hypothetical protein